MKFTVAIPVYKSQFLRECIDSVLGQTIEDYEVVILNDASPENIDAIVETFTESRIRYFKNEVNVGAVDLVRNWNKCLEYAQGDYFICIGDDDRLMPDCLEMYSKMIERHPDVDLFHARTLQIDENGEYVGITPEYPEAENVFSFMLHRFNNGSQYVGDFCYRTSHLRVLGGFHYQPLAWGSDHITALKAMAGHGVVNLPNPTFCYRVNRLSISSTGQTAIKLLATNQEEHWYEVFIEQTPPADLFEKLCKEDAIRRYRQFFRKLKALQLHYDLMQNRWRIIHWWRKRNTYALSLSTLAAAIYYACRKS